MNEFIDITGKQVEEALLNLKQLTFEVTDGCNLRCKYCGYGELYEGYDKRESKYLPVSKAKVLIDYLASLWKKGHQRAVRPLTYISFYGGEPLMNMPFIREIIAYTEGLPETGRTFVFSMTTNAVLLDRYMDYLAEKEVHLLISLDGDREGHSYRVDQKGKNSFDKVWENVKGLQKKYPDYFDRAVNFNSVLHNRNTVEGIHEFIRKNFGKNPAISELNNSGIRKDKLEEFEKTYRNKYQSLHQAEHYEKISEEMFLNDPDVHELIIFLHRYSGNVFENYNDLLIADEEKKRVETGTCLPFSKKMFLTVNGKIIPCERIDHCFALGQVYEDRVELDPEKTADRFNRYKKKLSKQCETCYNVKGCIQCMYYVEGITEESPVVCHGYMNKERFLNYQEYILRYLSMHPQLYAKIMKEVLVD